MSLLGFFLSVYLLKFFFILVLKYILSLWYFKKIYFVFGCAESAALHEFFLVAASRGSGAGGAGGAGGSDASAPYCSGFSCCGTGSSHTGFGNCLAVAALRL